MMVSQQWKAICCRRETVRGTELDIVQFWSFDRTPYTAVLRTFAQSQKVSIVFIQSVLLSVHKNQCGSHQMDLC